MKRIVAFLLAVMLILGSVPVSPAYAEELQLEDTPSVVAEEVTEPVEETTMPTEEPTEPMEESTEPAKKSTESAQADNACGESALWTLSDGVLTISGTGAMEDYAAAADAPWYASRASITKVVVEDGITHIGSRAFYNCTALTDVSIGSGVTTIGQWAFQGDTALTALHIPASVTAVDASAFRNCSGLSSLSFDGNAPTVGENAFTGCTSDLSITCYEGTTGWDTFSAYTVNALHVGQWVVDAEPTCTTDGSRHLDCSYCNDTFIEAIPGGHKYVDGVCSVCQDQEVLLTGSCGSNITYTLYYNGLLAFTGSGSMSNYWSASYIPWRNYTASIKAVTIAEGITGICDYAFYNCENLESITIPEGITKIGSEVFKNCASLTQITIPKSITYIGSQAFYGCESLMSVYISDMEAWLSIEFWGYDSSPFTHGSDEMTLYLNGTPVTELVVPEGITQIPGYSFCHYRRLESITFSESVTTIGAYAFYGCHGLQSVTIPDSVTTVNSRGFFNCMNLQSVTIGDGVTKIGSSAFASCYSLETVTFGQSVASIDTSAFDSCSKLQSVVLPDSVTTVGSNVFYGCSKLQSVTLSKSMTAIRSSMFYNCYALESIVIPEGVTTIGESAFRNCGKLRSISIPNSLTTVGYEAFYNCYSLQDVHISDLEAWMNIPFDYDNPSPLKANDNSKTLYLNGEPITDLVIPEGVTTIGYSAFESCNIESVTIPASLTTMEGRPFLYCENLTAVYISDLAAWLNIDCQLTPLGENQKDKTLYLNGQPLTDVVIPEGVTSIPEYAFSNCVDLKSVTMHNGITDIGSLAFRGCTGLTSITIPQSVTQIFYGTFYDCTGLKSVNIPEGVTYIGDSAFYNCSSLQSITIPSSVTTIEYDAFENCSSLAFVTFGEGIANIGGDRFYGCKNIQSVFLPKSLTSLEKSTFFFSNDLDHILYAGTEDDWNARASGYWADYPQEFTFHFNATGEEMVAVNAADCMGMVLQECSVCGKRVYDRSYTGQLAEHAYKDGVCTVCGATHEVTVDGIVYRLKDSSAAVVDFTGTNRFPVIAEEIEGLPVTSIEIPDPCFNFELISLTVPTSVTYINNRFAYIWHTLYKGSATQWNQIVFYQDEAGCFDYIHYNATGDEISQAESTCVFSGVFSCNVCGSYGYDYDTRPAHQYVNGVCTGCGLSRDMAMECSFDGNGITINRYTGTATEVVIPDTIAGYPVTGIGSCAFEGYSDITKVSIPDTVTAIGYGAFYGCSALTEVVIPKNITSISGNTFYGCSSLTNIVIPEGVTIIGSDAFNGCSGLTEVTLPKSLKTVYINAFAGCSGLKCVVYPGSSSQKKAIKITAGNDALKNAAWHSSGCCTPSISVSYELATGYPILTWKDTTCADSYEVYRASSSKGAYTLIATTEDATFTDTDVTGGKALYYKVKALNDSGSATSSYKKIYAKLAQPEITVEVKASSGKPTVSWEAVAGAKKYEVYRATSETGSYKKLTSTSKLSYTYSDASVGKTYFFKIRAVASSSSANSAYSDIHSCLTICGQPVVTLKITSSTGKPELSWGKVSGAAGYEIYRAFAEDGNYELLSTQTSRSFKDTSAPADTQCFYKVLSLGARSELNCIEPAAQSIFCTCARPVISAVTDTVSGKPTITWAAVEGAVSYEVTRATKSSGKYTSVGTVDEAVFTDETAVVGKTYYYKVTAIGASGSRSAVSSYDSTKCKCAQPVITVALDENGNSVLSWETVDGAKKYKVYRATSENGKYKEVKSTSGLSYTDTKAAAGKTYYYKVKAYPSSSSYSSVYSLILSITAE